MFHIVTFHLLPGLSYVQIFPDTLRRVRCSLVRKALDYKPEGGGFETRWDKQILSIYLILPAALDPEVYSASNRNECQKQKNNVSRE
jgi:hypothetical protein